jgi:type I restriction enzyme, S subunit
MSSEWLAQKLSALGEFDRGKSKHRPRDAAHLYGGAYPFIQTGDVTNSDGRITSFRQTYSDAGLAQSRLWPTGTLAITIAANIAETALLTFPACFPDSVVGFVADPKKADVRFVEYLFRAMRKQVKSHAYGSAQENINLDVLRKLQFLIPPLNLQSTIADCLSLLDDRIALLRETNTTLEAIAQALFKSWFVDFDPVLAKQQGLAPAGMDEATAALFPDSFEESALGPVPNGWPVQKLADLLVLQRGFDLPAQSRTPGCFPIIAASGPSGTHAMAMAKGPGVVTGRSGVLGRVFLELGDYWPLNTTLWVKEFRAATPCFAYELLRLLDFKAFNAGSAVPTLNRNHIHGLPYLAPARACVEAYERMAMRMHERAQVNEQQAQTLATLRDTLLPRLISGQLRLPEAAAFEALQA